MSEQTEKAYSADDVKKMIEEIRAVAISAALAAANNVAALTLENFAKGVLNLKVETSSEGARIGAEEMRRKIASSAISYAQSLRETKQVEG